MKQHIWYKITLRTFTALHGLAAVCLDDNILRHKTERVLRSASEVLLCPPKITKTNYPGDCAFATVSPNVWNSLPTKLPAITNIIYIVLFQGFRQI